MLSIFSSAWQRYAAICSFGGGVFFFFVSSFCLQTNCKFICTAAQGNNLLLLFFFQKEESWRVGSPRKSAPSPAALSASQQKTKDEEILMQLAMQSAEYQKLASAPPSVSGRDRSGVNSTDQSVVSSRHRSATSTRHPASSRRSSLLTVTTVEESGEQTNVILVQDETDNVPEPETEALETFETSENVNASKETKGSEEIKQETIPALRTSEKQETSVKSLKETSEEGQSPSNDDGKPNEKSPNKHKRRPSGGSKKSKACCILWLPVTFHLMAVEFSLSMNNTTQTISIVRMSSRRIVNNYAHVMRWVNASHVIHQRRS